MPKDLHVFLKEYEKNHPEDVIHVEKEISTRYEITAMVKAFEKKNQYPILIFHNVTMEKGKKSPFPVVTNIVATRARAAEGAGVDLSRAALEVMRKSRKERKTPVQISRKEAPCKEVIKKVPQEMSLFDIPFVRHNALDGGPFFSSGFFTVYDLDTHIDNCALIRGNIWEDDRTGVGIYSPHSTLVFKKYEDRGLDMPAVYWIGHHPGGIIGSQMKQGFPESHYESMGGMLGEPLRVVPSETLGDDFLVPADAEFIVEGYLPAMKRAPEGPFGEYPRYYGPQRWNPYMKVTCITHRKDAYFHDLTPGAPEHYLTGCFGIEAVLFENVKKAVPGLKNVYMPVSGCCRFHAYLQIAKQKAADGREAILAALLSDPRIKHVISVDDDIDLFDEREVLWAVATRTQWDQDVIIIPNLTGGLRDPSAGDPKSAKGGIDATKPLAKDMIFPYEIKSPIDVVKKINPNTLADYIPREKLEKVPVPKSGEI